MSKNKERFGRFKILRSASTPRKWFNVEKDAEIPQVYIFDQIGMDFWGDGVNPKSFMDEVKNIKEDKFELHINSPGGFVYDGFAIYNFLNRMDKEIIVYIDGISASIASVIAMAGDKIIMPANAEFMIHDPWTIMIGNADEFRKEAEQMDSMKESIMGIYEARTNLDRKTLSKMMSKETYIKGEEAVEWGFADILESPKQMAACAFDTIFADGAEVVKNKSEVNNKRALEKKLREAGYSKTEAVAIVNRSESVKIGDVDKKEENRIVNKPLTIIMR